MSPRHTTRVLSDFAWALYALAGLGGICLLWVYAPWVLVAYGIISIPVTLLVLSLFKSGE